MGGLRGAGDPVIAVCINTKIMIEDIREIRKEKKVKQKDLAKMVGINATYLCQIEAGEVNPSYKIISDLIHALGYTIVLVRK